MLSKLKSGFENLSLLSNNTKFSPEVCGRVIKFDGSIIKVTGIKAPVGALVFIEDDGNLVETEVVSFDDEFLFLMPVYEIENISISSKVCYYGNARNVLISSDLMGRVVDSNCNPIDGKGEIVKDIVFSKRDHKISPINRKEINRPFDVGVKAINSLLTVGAGQRMGIFAGSGVGKSVLLGMLTKYSEADVIVVGLIGERGREVKDFIDNVLGEEGRKKAVVVACPADESPILRVRAADLTMSIAEQYRDDGKNVLLLMDSVTRYAMALREIYLSFGTLPINKGYPAAVFSKIPDLIERAGNSNSSGSMTAFFTVLIENDNFQDPISEAARGILDGHILLSRKIADSGRYPAIDILSSISRLFNEVTDQRQKNLFKLTKYFYSMYKEKEEIINIGYTKGNDSDLDKAIVFYPRINDFLSQDINEKVSIEESLNLLTGVFAGGMEENRENN